MPKDEKELKLSIPRELFDLIEDGAGKAGFSDINSFLVFIMEEIFKKDVQRLEKLEKEFLEQRLRDLGYM